MKKSVPSTRNKEPWVMHYKPSNKTGDKSMDTFCAKKTKDFPVPHVKINETDT